MHLINRLQLELTCADEALAFNMRRNFAAAFQQCVAQVADTVCSDLVAGDNWLRIERLELDLGAFTSNGFEEGFKVALEAAFQKQLQEKIANIPQQMTSGLRARLELWMHFFRTGSLPWWAAGEEVNSSAITMELIEQEAARLKQLLYTERRTQNFWTRMAFQLNEQARSAIVTLTDELRAARDLLTNWIGQSGRIAAGVYGIEAGGTGALIDAVILKNAVNIFERISGAELLHRFENVLPGKRKTNISTADVFSYRAELIKRYEEQMGIAIAADEARPAVQDDKRVSISDLKVPDADGGEENKYVVRHGGLVLLAPFLTAFVNNLQLLDGKQWKSRAAQYRAVHLLKYLATGQQQVPEFALVLEKICCGLAVEEPVPLQIELTEKEITEAEDLLKAVVGHWTALKNTSVQGLRESFLKRDGIVTAKEKGWLLQVERKTLDVLIDSIPWGYSTLVFPWDTLVIYVEW